MELLTLGAVEATVLLVSMVEVNCLSSLRVLGVAVVTEV